MTLDGLLEQVDRVREVKTQRDADRAVVVTAIFRLLEKLREALGGEQLKGCPEDGVRVRGDMRLHRDGQLWISSKGVTFYAEAQDIVVEDLEPVLRAVEEALRVHLARCEERGAVFARARKLAEKLYSALE